MDVQRIGFSQILWNFSLENYTNQIIQLLVLFVSVFNFVLQFTAFFSSISIRNWYKNYAKYRFSVSLNKWETALLHVLFLMVFQHGNGLHGHLTNYNSYEKGQLVPLTDHLHHFWQPPPPLPSVIFIFQWFPQKDSGLTKLPLEN